MQRVAAAAATHLILYRSNPVIIIPYILEYVAADIAASRCHVYGKAPLGVKWNSLEHVILNSTGRGDQTVNNCFYVLFVFTSWWQGLLTCRHFLR